MTWKVLQGDVCEKLAELPGKSVQTVVTSPPY
jgi:DNA modification methylase